MAIFIPLGTGQYTAEKPRHPKDVNISASVGITSYANDAAAAAAGVKVGETYHTAGAVKVRLA